MAVVKKRALFIDNTEFGYCNKRDFAKSIGGKAVLKIRKAGAVVEKRKKAIELLLGMARAKYVLAKTPKEKAMLAGKIRFFEKMRQKPFELVSFNADLEGYNGHGMELHRWVKIARELQKGFPKTKLVFSSNNPVLVSAVKKFGARIFKEKNPAIGEIEFEDMAKKTLGLRQRISIEELEKSALKMPLRKSLRGLKFPDEMAFFDALTLVQTKNRKKRKEIIFSLYREVRSNRLSPNTFKAVLRCGPLPESMVFKMVRNKSGIVVFRNS